MKMKLNLESEYEQNKLISILESYDYEVQKMRNNFYISKRNCYRSNISYLEITTFENVHYLLINTGSSTRFENLEELETRLKSYEICKKIISELIELKVLELV